jgi:hypothetical protein
MKRIRLSAKQKIITVIRTMRTAPQESVNSFSGTVLSERPEINRWRIQTQLAVNSHTHQKALCILGVLFMQDKRRVNLTLIRYYTAQEVASTEDN